MRALTFGKVPVRTGLCLNLFRIRRSIGRVEIDAPSRDRASKFLAATRVARFFSCIGHSAASSMCRWNDERLDAAVEFVRHQMVAFRDFVERNPMSDDVARLEHAVLDVLEQPRPLTLDRALVGA